MYIDITNQKFGKLTPLKYLGNSYWECFCECGNLTKANSWNIRSGHTTSCGCVHSKYGGNIQGDKLYRLYNSIKKRTSKLRKDYHNKTYIERGVKVCDEWKNNFFAFKKWALDNGYDYNKNYKEQTIDRIDPFGNYEPSNCRFVSMFENNSRETKRKGVFCLSLQQQKEICMLHKKGMLKKDLAEKFYVSRATIRKVINLYKEELQDDK